MPTVDCVVVDVALWAVRLALMAGPRRGCPHASLRAGTPPYLDGENLRQMRHLRHMRRTRVCVSS